MEHVNLGEYLVNGELNEEKLVGVIRDPTLIILAYCFTERSEVDDILRAAGVYAAPILLQEQATITEGRFVILDENQKQIIQRFSTNSDANLFICGTSGM